jgi:hypothetical protein
MDFADDPKIVHYDEVWPSWLIGRRCNEIIDFENFAKFTVNAYSYAYSSQLF